VTGEKAELESALVKLQQENKDKTQELYDAENLVKELSKKTDLDRSSSYRCGMFFPDPADVTGLPVSPLLIFNSSWPAPECGAGGPDYDKYNQHCNGLFARFSGTLSLSDPSIRTINRDKGLSIGDDICRFIKDKIKAPFVGGKSKKFPDGLQIAMFSNACGDEEWTNSESYHGEKVCCKTGEYIPCEEL